MADSDSTEKRSDRRFRTPGGRCDVCRRSKKGSCGTAQSTLRCLRRKEEGLPYVTSTGVKILPKGWPDSAAMAPTREESTAQSGLTQPELLVPQGQMQPAVCIDPASLIQVAVSQVDKVVRVPVATTTGQIAFITPNIDVNSTAQLLAHLTSISATSASTGLPTPHGVHVLADETPATSVQNREPVQRTTSRATEPDTPRSKNKIPENRRCQHEDCNKWAKYSKTGERLFCKAHMKERGLNPIEVERKPCRHDGCNKEAKTSTEGTTMYCISHMRMYGLQPRIRLCTHPGCSKGAKTSTDSQRLFCRAHMKEYGMTSVKSHCKHPGCMKAAAADNEGHWQFCVAHIRQQGMQPRPTHLRYTRTTRTGNRSSTSPNTMSLSHGSVQGTQMDNGPPEVQSRRPALLTPLRIISPPAVTRPLGARPTSSSDGNASDGGSYEIKPGPLPAIRIECVGPTYVPQPLRGVQPPKQYDSSPHAPAGLNPRSSTELNMRPPLEIKIAPRPTHERAPFSLEGSAISSTHDLTAQFNMVAREEGHGTSHTHAMESTSVTPQSLKGDAAVVPHLQAVHPAMESMTATPAAGQVSSPIPTMPVRKVKLQPWQMCQQPECTNRACSSCPGRYCYKHLRARVGCRPRKAGTWTCFGRSCVAADLFDSMYLSLTPHPSTSLQPLPHIQTTPLFSPPTVTPMQSPPPLIPVLSISVYPTLDPATALRTCLNQTWFTGLHAPHIMLPAPVSATATGPPRPRPSPQSVSAYPRLSPTPCALPTTRRFCGHEDCERRPVTSQGKQLEYCAVHCDQYGYDLSRPLCQHGSCVRAALALPDPDGPRLYCLIHMKDHTTSIPLPRCKQLGCRRILPINSETAYCSRHQPDLTEQDRSGTSGSATATGTNMDGSSEGGNDTARTQPVKRQNSDAGPPVSSRRGSNKRKGSRPEAAVPAGEIKAHRDQVMAEAAVQAIPRGSTPRAGSPRAPVQEKLVGKKRDERQVSGDLGQAGKGAKKQRTGMTRAPTLEPIVSWS